MASVEEFFELRIATVAPDETPPAGAHMARCESPRDGWFEIPAKVRYVAPVPRSLDAALASRRVRANFRRVQARFALVVDDTGDRFAHFRELYLRTVVARPRGVDRLGPRESLDGRWTGLHLYDRDRLAGGILLQRVGRHYSVSYGAFDPGRSAKLDLEHALILHAMQRSIDAGFRTMSLGVDTNRYGHHLSLGLPAYKWRIGFRAEPYPPGGREFIKPLRLDPFDRGLFFYAFGDDGLAGHLFPRGPQRAADWRHALAPPMHVHDLK